MLWFAADIPWVCLPHIQWALSLHPCLKYRQPRETRHKKRKTERQWARGGGSGLLPGTSCPGEVWGWTGRQQRALQERRPGQGRLPSSSARPAWGQLISLSLSCFFFFNSKLGTIPRWGKEEDGESFKKINKKNKPKVSPINPEHAWQWRKKKRVSV